jgi:hypothetical protein
MIRSLTHTLIARHDFDTITQTLTNSITTEHPVPEPVQARRNSPVPRNLMSLRTGTRRNTWDRLLSPIRILRHQLSV